MGLVIASVARDLLHQRVEMPVEKAHVGVVEVPRPGQYGIGLRLVVQDFPQQLPRGQLRQLAVSVRSVGVEEVKPEELLVAAQFVQEPDCATTHDFRRRRKRRRVPLDTHPGFDVSLAVVCKIVVEALCEPELAVYRKRSDRRGRPEPLRLQSLGNCLVTRVEHHAVASDTVLPGL